MGDRFHFDPSLVAVDAVDPGDRPLHIEVGFGKDVRILREARLHPQERFAGIEISRKKAASFCRKVARAGLRNVRCYRGDVRRVLEQMLPPGSVASFTIMFPDPWPKRRHHKHRWVDARTAARIVRALVPGGPVIVATDHEGYRDQIRAAFAGAGLRLEQESSEVPEPDSSIFAQRFERLGVGVTYQRWRKPVSP